MQHHRHSQNSILTHHHSCHGNYARRQLPFYALAVLIVSSLLFVSCEKQCATFTPEERKAADSIVATVSDAASLSLLQKRLERKGDRLGSIVALREWGKMLRSESRFEEALRIHSKGQQQAEAAGDTLEWVQALNNIGTDYRRMGVLDVAYDYHYRAWVLCKECCDTSYMARKNSVVSLNGLGNVYMTLGNFERADSALRMALAGEQQLNSTLGQAINYANLGSIFERHGRTDSAWVYYRKSMALNTKVGNVLGMSLSHTNFGSLYEKAGQYDKATAEYEEAYQLMKASKDEWHALNTLIALSGIYHTTGNDAKMMEYLGTAKAMAERIKSPEHLADIHTLYYKHYMQAGDYRSALASYEKATVLQDSVLNMEKVNRIQNTSLNIERSRQAREMDAARKTLENERAARKVGFTILGFALLVLIGAMVVFLYLQHIYRRNHLELKKIAAMRENFFTNITHEFRTPLTVILGLSRDLQQDGQETTREKALVIERQGKGLLALINQLLDISKIKSAVGRPEWKSGNIVAFLTMIVEGYHDYARSREVELQLFAEGEVVMDFIPDYVVKVMNNLLSNAFKYTPPYGKISVVVKREERQLRVDVSDTGRGISRENLPHVFEPFYQGKDDSQHVGSGVGLALVKQIVGAVSGEISVSSEVGRGTTFRLLLPIHNRCVQPAVLDAESPAPLLPEKESELVDSSGEDNACRLLIIEDNRDIAAYIGSQFAGRYAVAYAADGAEGLEKARELVPDLIITDLMMPGMDGLEVCRSVRADEIINHIPIIIVTAKISEEERIRGIEAGADAYLAKPFNADELRMRVEKLLEGRRLLQTKFAALSAAPRKEEEPAARTAEDVDMRFLAKLSGVVYMLISDGCEVDVATVASHMCMSPRQFYRKVNALTGHTPSAYIMRLRIKRAKTLLAGSPQMSLADVAAGCGFSDYSNFVRAFKNVCGVIPSDYRKENGK